MKGCFWGIPFFVRLFKSKRRISGFQISVVLKCNLKFSEIFGCPILCFDVVYNRATTQDKAYYWANVDELVNLLKNNKFDGAEMKVIAQKQYTWNVIASQYEALF